jgi:hypothetical protein
MKIKHLALVVVLLALPFCAQGATPEPDCFGNLVCAVKEKIRWRTPAWSQTTCQNVAEAIQLSASKYGVNRELVLAMAMNESNLDETASRPYYRDGQLYAQDSGLMQVRCVIGSKGTCINGVARGLTLKQVMNPTTNIELGVHELAMWRDGAAKVRSVVKVGGRPKLVTEVCSHRDHAWWAHYNWGPKVIDTIPARHYPHRVAVLYAALVKTQHQDLPAELMGPISLSGKREKPRTIHKPVGVRQVQLVASIHACSGPCGQLAGILEGHAGSPEAAASPGEPPPRRGQPGSGRALSGRSAVLSSAGMYQPRLRVEGR